MKRFGRTSQIERQLEQASEHLLAVAKLLHEASTLIAALQARVDAIETYIRGQGVQL